MVRNPIAMLSAHYNLKALLGIVMSDGVCTGFEPQNYLRDRCRKCFRLRIKHDLPASVSPTPRSPAMSSPENVSSVSPPSSLSAEKAERRRSWRDRNPDEGPDNEIPDNITETSSVVSFKSARSKLLPNAKSMESISSIVDDRSMVTAASGSLEFENDDDRCITPTEMDFDSRQLRSENIRLQEQVSKLKEERKRWTLKRPPKTDSHQDETLVQILEERLAEAESLIQDYRDENTSLKCELREINEGLKTKEMDSKLRSAEDLCDELMVENEQLKNEVRDLQQEVEEMQDQYREEEIEEFRELQRELEQNAKNCRVLQFKLKKAERAKEQYKTENEVLTMKMREQGRSGNVGDNDGNESDENSITSDSTVHSQSVKVRELESELRIAKEVSFRLHKELETAEEKRYKLEDEVFYYKEKTRELQTQSKWRDNRNKTDYSARRLSTELLSEMSKEDLQILIERESDLRDQLKFAEEDLKRTRNQMQELENENEELMQKLAKLNEVTNSRGSLSKKPVITRSSRLNDIDNDAVKRLQDLDIVSSNGSAKLNAEVEKDITRLIVKIQELEKQNSELQIQLRRQAINGDNSSRDKATSVELRQERQQRKELEAELTEFKQLIAKSDNSKLIAMATKVELLTNQLNMATERANALHKKTAKESGAEESYVDQLKKQIETLEKQTSELIAKETFKVPNKQDLDSPSMATADEIEHCCVVLASVEAQTTRICKQLDRIDNSQKEERRRSLSKESSASIAADLVGVMAELKVIRQALKTHKLSDVNDDSESHNEDGVAKEPQECSFCAEREKGLETLREEVGFYKKKNKELTKQVLQTENRWTVEIENKTHNYKTEIRRLENELGELKSGLKEQEEVANARMVTLIEKQKTIEEQTARMNRLEDEIHQKQKIIQDYEKEQKALKEFEIKYRKMEDMYNKEKEKYDRERSKIKSDMATAKKKADEATNELETTRRDVEQKENEWNDQKQNLQNEINSLKKKKNSEESEEEEEEEDGPSISPRPVIRTINYRVTKINELGVPELKEKLADQQQKYSELDGRFNKLQLAKETVDSELQRLKDVVERERNDSQHRLRQNEKIRSFEMDALQQKFTSRMNIMENTNKSLHTQLVQIRRERDRFREGMNVTEQKLLDEQRRCEEERRKNVLLANSNSENEKKIKTLKAEIDRISHELKLKIEAHRADCALWDIQKKHLESNKGNTDSKDVRITEDALNAAEAVQKQYAEYQKFYTKEVARLNKKIKEMGTMLTNKEYEFEKKTNELDEQIKILEIDQKNLLQAKQMQVNTTEILRADQDRLMQVVQQAEVQKLTRKYKITAVVDRLQTIRNLTEDTEISHIINQLNTIKEDDNHTAFTSSDLNSYEVDSALSSARTVNSICGSTYSTNPIFLPNQRSLSIESTSTWDSRFQDYTNRSISPVKKMVNYPDPPPTFMLSKDTKVEYDREGKLHYVPKTISRSLLYDNATAPIVTKSTGTLTDDTDADNDSLASHSRMGSAGTNILYKIRREELAKGKAPSVRTIAKAFETLDRPKTKRGFFNIRKSRSVDTGEDKPSANFLKPSALTRNTESMSKIESDLPSNSVINKSSTTNPASHYGTLTRGGRNPFKNMGSKLVDRVRRSLSKSGRTSRDQTPERAPLAPNEDISPLDENAPTATEKTKVNR
ncbi:unnamed protein product [Bursaphelenchus okinawaensis]|uniref:Uncharacterized protein n=1 Tax=Bursaphelenchus okinawaensis TaxID=465554 RepID=A0A811LPS5_9BILA|nr:unnamed protein product [Bursaphelenchus okinawaensis]CAG9125922.1 unnamed protein product [Bursaphelenchus okinawaensis]